MGEKLEEAKKEVPELEWYKADVGTVAGVKHLAKQVLSTYPDINVLINNAGVIPRRNLSRPDDDLESMTEALDINVKGPMHLTSLLIDAFIKNNGTIINISSALAFVPNMALPIYSASKAALHSYTISLRQQLEEKVTVLEIAAPRVNTSPDQKKGPGIPVEDFTRDAMKGIVEGKELILIDLAREYHFMSRLAPGFIANKVKNKAKQFLLP